jgi:hypothetical protein
MSRPIGLFVLLAAAACASAQVTLSTVQRGVATPAPAVVSFGPVALGSVADIVFRLTNTGSSPVYLTDLAVAGSTLLTPPYTPYFSVVCPPPPALCGAAADPKIGPSGTLDFTVQFEPFQLGSPSATASANMTVCAAAVCAGNTISTILSGWGVPGLSVLWNSQPLGAGETVSFGSVQVGSSQTIALMLSNPANNVPLAVPTIPLLTGGAFSLAGSALSAPTVAPGSSAELDVIFTPTVTGPQQATLTIGLFTYPLAGTGVSPPPPPFPAPSIQLTLATPASAQQGSLSVSLASGSVSSGSGTVTLAFQSAVGGVSDDPAVTFADGTRAAAFTVAEGSSAGQFAGGPSVPFRTGTTAGTLVFTVTLGSNSPPPTTVTISPAVIGIDAAVAVRNVACDAALAYCTTTNIQIQIDGWDNTRSASQVVFTFFDSAGNPISPGNITYAAAAKFQEYFTGPLDIDGAFKLTVFFPVTGDSDKVVTAVVALTNSAGTVPSTKITF